MQQLKHLAMALVSEEDGQGMVEYALILAIVSVVAIATLTTLGTNLNNVFTKAAGSLK